ncbi:MAG: aquaporin [bacterium]|nr:aquaporin [bacterium]
MYQKFLAEFFGTLTLTFVVILSLSGVFPIPTPVLAAITLGLFVYSVGHISGTHINPAVTIGLWSIKKIDMNDALSYIMAQIFGAATALILAMVMDITYDITASSTIVTGLAEMAGMILFTFGIASVVFGNVHKAMSGVVVGTSLFMGIAIAALMGSNGVLNPAVAVGIKSFSVMYLIGPLVGSVIGMKLYEFVNSNSNKK